MPLWERRELLAIIDEEVDRMNDLVGEAIKTAQLGDVQLDLKPQTIEEIIDAALDYCKTRLGQRLVSVQLGPRLMPVRAERSAQFSHRASRYASVLRGCYIRPRATRIPTY